MIQTQCSCAMSRGRFLSARGFGLGVFCLLLEDAEMAAFLTSIAGRYAVDVNFISEKSASDLR